eukprot:11549411-Prorocentrum_lima.AAC.1
MCQDGGRYSAWFPLIQKQKNPVRNQSLWQSWRPDAAERLYEPDNINIVPSLRLVFEWQPHD